MLQTLRKLDPNDAQRVLSGVTSELLPNPEVGDHTRELKIAPDLHSEIWREILRRTKVDPSDTTPPARAKVLQFLFDEMTQVALPTSGLESIKARLSYKGELRPDLYEVKFTTAFITSKEHGVRPNHVQEAIRNADDVEHINMLNNEAYVSLFLRTHADFPSGDPFALLVLAMRVNASLHIHMGLRVYRSDVDFGTARRPSEVLQLLVAKYGYQITIGHVTAKLIMDETTTIGGKNFSDSIKVHALQGSSIFGDVIWRKRTLHNSYGIAVALALDQAKYAADLRKHGVHVEGGNYRIPQDFSAVSESSFDQY